MFDRRLILNFDVFLLISVLIICALGILNLQSICSSSDGGILFYQKQTYWVLTGLFLVMIIININYVSIIRYAYYFHAISLFLLFFVLFYGQTKYGSQRWISIAGFTLQPSEIAKMTFILAMAKFFSDNMSERVYYLKDLFLPFLFLFITFLPIYLQPDLGTAGMIVLIFFAMLFFLNINKKSVFLFLVSSFLLLPFFWFFLKDYQKRRILVFINPDLDPLNAGYQVIQSKIAVGSGGLIGKGFKMGTQSQLRFLPEQHTDFVFSVWAEEWGFLGCLFLLFFFFFVLYRGLYIAYNSKTFYGSFVSVGIVAFLFFQIVINVCMTVGLFPVVGVPLPFFSYGGSSMFSGMIGIAFLLNINMRKFK